MLLTIRVYRKIISHLDVNEKDQSSNEKQEQHSKAYSFFHLLVRRNILKQIKRFSKKNDYMSISEEFSLKDKPELKKKIVWVMWWQKENMPEIISKNIEFLKNSDTYELVVINQSNIFNYMNVPQPILDDLQHSRISFAHFSDLVRMTLLYEYGGVWIDSTVFVANNKWEYLFDHELITIKNSGSAFGNRFVPNGRWSLYVIGGHAGLDVFEFVRNILYLYMINRIKFPDYFITDYLIDIAERQNIGDFSRLLGELNENNENHEKLEALMDKVFNPLLYQQLTKNTSLFKLTYKKDYKKRIDGKITFFGKLYGEK